MIRIAVAMFILPAVPNLVHAQLLIQAGHGKIEQAAAIPPEIAGNTTLHFMKRSFYFTGGDEIAVFRRGDGGTVKLLLPSPLNWSLSALEESTQPVAIQLRRGSATVTLEIVRNSPLEKHLIELLDTESLGNDYSLDDAQIIDRLRDSLRGRKPSPEMKKGAEFLLGIYRDPDAVPSEAKSFYDAWREALSCSLSPPTEPATEAGLDRMP
jgi:hypothetical protein